MSRIRTESDGDGIACPHCGKILRDLWDYDFGQRETVETECGACGEPFTLTRIVTVDYTAEADVSDSSDNADAPDAPKGGPWCDASSPESFGCTRAPSHDGDHVARGTRFKVYARWPQ